MCLLIEQPKGYTFSRADIADFLWHNEDGAGFMYGDGKRLHVVRTLEAGDVDSVYRATVAGKHAVLHFRQATHGPVTLENTHPYMLTDRVAVAHNGILSCGNPIRPELSDSWHFAEYVLRPVAERDPELLFTAEYARFLSGVVGTGNKLAFCHADGRVQLVNASGGVMHKRVWYSNTYAWSAPTALMPTPRYYSRDLWEGEDWENTRVASCAVERVAAPQGEATDTPCEGWRAIRAAWAEGGMDDVASWIDDNPEDAIATLTGWLPADMHVADEVLSNPERVAGYVCDALKREEQTKGVSA